MQSQISVANSIEKGRPCCIVNGFLFMMGFSVGGRGLAANP